MRGHIAQKNGRYYPVISVKDQGTGTWKRKWLGGNTTKRKAERALAEVVAQVNKGILPIPNRETVAQLCRNYLATTAPNRVRPITLQSYKSMIENHFISRLGAKPASALTPDDLEFVKASMGKAGLSNTTIGYVLRIIHRVLKDAVRKGRLYRNVAELVDLPPGKKPESEVWNDVELDRFLTAAANSDYYEFYSILALTGTRRGEALALKWSNVDLDVTLPKISIRRTAYKLDTGQWRFEEPKTKRSRRDIQLPISLSLLLSQLWEQKNANAEWCGREFSEDDFVFARPDSSLPDPRYLSKVFQQIVQGAGLKRIRLHDLRHTYATLLRAAGVPIEAISKALGHASVLVTLKIYDHWEGEPRASADAMDQILEKLSGNKNEGAFVRNTLEEGEGIECRPYRSRTCDTLIKSQVVKYQDFKVFS